MNAENSPTDSPVKAAPNPCGRSAVSNGSRLFVAADGRSKGARRWKDLYRIFMEQTGGRNEVMVRTLASLCLQREEIDSRLARGEPVDSSELVSVAGAISRLATKLGLDADANDEPGEDVTEQIVARIRQAEVV